MRILTLLLTLLAFSAKGQQLNWEFGLFLGGANYQGDLVETLGPLPAETNLAYGGFARYHPGRRWALRLGLFSGHISGSDQNFSDLRYVQSRNISFRTRLTETALTVEWEPFGRRRYPPEGGYKKIFSPYLFAGGAYSFFRNGADYSGVPRTIMLELVERDKAAYNTRGAYSLPMGGGIKIDLSKFTVLSLEAGLRKAFSDLLDGVRETGNPDSDDWYSFGGITFSRRFGPPDYDRDGIVDREDACPRLAGVASAQGCPDADGDGVEDLEDVCPLVAGSIELNGCPDRDGDKVIDLHDACPDVAGLKIFDGCPDTDEDGIIDSEDRCPDVAGVLEEQGCPYPDRDADGIIDKEDACPDLPGVPEESGCPLPDTDADGVLDKEDACPTLPGPPELDGCPDTDADGIIDPDDRCPNSPGPSASDGCPEIGEAEKAVLKLAMETVRFETASAILKPDSRLVLDQIADILIRYPDYQLRISGHTDSRGNDQTNLVLSKNRAESCFNYLASTGINPNRMIHQGFGETQPLGDNATTEGRRINRRVEFEVFVPEKAVEELAETTGKLLQPATEETVSSQTPQHPVDSTQNAPVAGLPEAATTNKTPATETVDTTQNIPIAGAPTESKAVTTNETPAAEAVDTTQNIPITGAPPESEVVTTNETPATETIDTTQNIPIAGASPESEVVTTNETPATETIDTTQNIPIAGAPPESEVVTTARKPSGKPVDAEKLDATNVQPDPAYPPVGEPRTPASDTSVVVIEPLPDAPNVPDQVGARSPNTVTRKRPPAKVFPSQTPDTIYWFEPQGAALDLYNTIPPGGLRFPDTYLQPDELIEKNDPDRPEAADDASSRQTTEEVPPLTEGFVPRSLMEQRVDSLERKIERLEERIRILETWILNQAPKTDEDLKTPTPASREEEQKETDRRKRKRRKEKNNQN